MHSLSLTADGKEELVCASDLSGSEEDNLDFCLIRRFLTDCSINFNAMRSTMATLWRPGKGVCIKEIGPQLCSFQFFQVVDPNRVLDEGPWSFNKHLLVLHHLQRGKTPTNLISHVWPFRCSCPWLRPAARQASQVAGERWLRDSSGVGILISLVPCFLPPSPNMIAQPFCNAILCALMMLTTVRFPMNFPHGPHGQPMQTDVGPFSYDVGPTKDASQDSV
ncbi:hypothetical protein GH714_025421 [Hevea brasiliensis]|uniref:DUF4283 domain-containing protein n=1 Tax=Hevea brasiliensis TaxID=3981 RepID=A0A6A6KU26_HEVBR|nr:hypothetical protein GH714_025421 [Hevea brasiliensis]